VAPSWLNLPCALKPAIGNGKRTFGLPGQSAAPEGPQQGPGSGPDPRLRTRSLWRHAFGGTREARRLALSASEIALAWVYETGGAHFQNTARFGRAGIEFLSGSPRALPCPSFEWKGRQKGAPRRMTRISETARFFGVTARAGRKWAENGPRRIQWRSACG
jgi:hypothetical protein